MIAQTIGVKMTKQIFADSISKVIPVLGGIVSGGLTYTTFRTYDQGCNRIRDSSGGHKNGSARTEAQ